jgi:hypothetical protein
MEEPTSCKRGLASSTAMYPKRRTLNTLFVTIPMLAESDDAKEYHKTWDHACTEDLALARCIELFVKSESLRDRIIRVEAESCGIRK